MVYTSAEEQAMPWKTRDAMGLRREFVSWPAAREPTSVSCAGVRDPRANELQVAVRQRAGKSFEERSRRALESPGKTAAAMEAKIVAEVLSRTMVWQSGCGPRCKRCPRTGIDL